MERAYYFLSDVGRGVKIGRTRLLYTDEFVDRLTRAGYVQGTKPDLELTEKGRTAVIMLNELYLMEEMALREERRLPERLNKDVLGDWPLPSDLGM